MSALRWVVSRIINSTALHVMLLIVVMAFIANSVPPTWTVFFRLFNGFCIFSLLLFGFYRFGQEAARLREDLRHHRIEIIDVMKRRDLDLQVLKENAIALAQETATIAAALAEENSKLFADTNARLETLSEKIAAQAAPEILTHQSRQIDKIEKTTAESNEILKKTNGFGSHDPH